MARTKLEPKLDPEWFTEDGWSEFDEQPEDFNAARDGIRGKGDGPGGGDGEDGGEILDEAKKIKYVDSGHRGPVSESGEYYEQPPKTWVKYDNGETILKFKTKSGREFSAHSVVWGKGTKEERMEVAFKDDAGSMERTGRGEAFQVFRNITPAIVSLINNTSQKRYTFSAEGSSRVSLYRKLASATKAALPDYNVYERNKKDCGSEFLISKRGEDLPKLLKGDDWTQLSSENSWRVLELAYSPEWLKEEYWVN